MFSGRREKHKNIILFSEPDKGNGRLLRSPYEAVCRPQNREANCRCIGLYRIHSYTVSEL